jgi:hypothetical protein
MAGFMLDGAMLALITVCFALAKAYAGLCKRVITPPTDDTGSR